MLCVTLLRYASPQCEWLSRSCDNPTSSTRASLLLLIVSSRYGWLPVAALASQCTTRVRTLWPFWPPGRSGCCPTVDATIATT